MSVIRLISKRVEKPWGRQDLWPGFDDVPEGDDPIGEIWFEAPEGAGHDDPELLVKYLFTSEKLSIQVHPDDAEACARGYERGKSECWQILAAEPHATIAMGMRQPITREELRAAAIDGTIEDLVDWKSVKAGELWYSSAGTVHAIGPGLVLIEIQQNVDLTYRLYDYGRPRELHLDDGIAVSNPVPYIAPFVPRDLSPGRRLLDAGGKFVIERWTMPARRMLRATPARPIWLVPIKGTANVEGDTLAAGGVWLVDSDTAIAVGQGIDMLVAYVGTEADITTIN